MDYRVGKVGGVQELEMSLKAGKHIVGKEEEDVEENELEEERLVERKEEVVKKDEDGLVKAGEEDKGLLVNKKEVIERKVMKVVAMEDVKVAVIAEARSEAVVLATVEMAVAARA